MRQDNGKKRQTFSAHPFQRLVSIRALRGSCFRPAARPSLVPRGAARAKARLASAAGRLAIAFGALATSACSSALVRGGPGFDAGTLAVSGVKTGVGGQIEAVGYSAGDATGFGIGGALELAGYSTAGDADPIVFTTAEGRYRRRLQPQQARSPYWELGTGLGLAWAPNIAAAAIPLQGEVGLQGTQGDVLWSVGVRERAMLLIGSGSPPLDVFNSVQLVAGLGFRLGRPR